MVDALVLAAGLSSRMGIDKMGLEISGETLLFRVLSQALQSQLKTIVAVTREPLGYDEFKGKVQFLPSRLRNVVNTSPHLGMSQSIRLGLTEIIEKSKSVMIMLGDQLFLNYRIIDSLISASQCNPNMIIAPTVEGRRTNPVIFPAEFLPSLNDIAGDQGGREILQSHGTRIKVVEFGNNYDDSDVDTPDDYLRACTKWSRHHGDT